MKRFAILILYNLLAFSIYAGVIPFQGLRERIARDPEGSLLLLDSLEEKGTIPNTVLTTSAPYPIVHNPGITCACTMPPTH